MSALVQVRHLSVGYGRVNPIVAVNDVTLEIHANEFVGLVGESGSGKSTLGFAMVRIERPPARILGGTISIDGINWSTTPKQDLKPHRWTTVAVVLQSGMNALNPVTTIVHQFRDVLIQHRFGSPIAMNQRIREVLQLVNIPERVLGDYPDQLSGGMRQRVGIALALVLHPKLLVMDEPTTALDVVVQWEILNRLKKLRSQEPFSLLFISHDLGVVAQLADRVMVMYAGEIVESQDTEKLVARPLHPYTEALLEIARSESGIDTTRRFPSIPGSPPDLRENFVGCPFAPRCKIVEERCLHSRPQLLSVGTGYVRCFVRQEGDMAHDRSGA